MNEQRTDSMGRILIEGECQRQNGKYVYSYIDRAGKRRQIEAWRLLPTDPSPPGKKSTVSLREQEFFVIQASSPPSVYASPQTNNSINSINNFNAFTGVNNIKTLYEAMVYYTEQHQNLARSSLERWNQFTKSVQFHSMGSTPINEIRKTDIMDFFKKLESKKLKRSTIESYRSYFRVATEYYLDTERITNIRNPFKEELTFLPRDDDNFNDDNLLMQHNNMPTDDELNLFLDFLKTKPKHRDLVNMIVIMRNTGMRVGEISGLREACLDFQKNLIYINKQVIRSSSGEYTVGKTKTDGSERIISMTPIVRERLLDQIKLRENFKKDISIDNYKHFLFVDKNNHPLCGNQISTQVYRQVQIYNGKNPDNQIKLHAHDLRAMFTTSALNDCELPMATVAKILGHTNIQTTSKYYNKPQLEIICDAFDQIEKVQNQKNKKTE